MATFDAPNREVCTLRRNRSNTPLQALVTLNDPVYVEAAQALARRMVSAGGGSRTAKIRDGFRACSREPPTDAEIKHADCAVRRRAGELPAEAGEAAALIGDRARTIGRPATIDPVELAAWTRWRMCC